MQECRRFSPQGIGHAPASWWSALRNFVTRRVGDTAARLRYASPGLWPWTGSGRYSSPPVRKRLGLCRLRRPIAASRNRWPPPTRRPRKRRVQPWQSRSTRDAVIRDLATIKRAFPFHWHRLPVLRMASTCMRVLAREGESRRTTACMQRATPSSSAPPARPCRSCAAGLSALQAKSRYRPALAWPLQGSVPRRFEEPPPVLLADDPATGGRRPRGVSITAVEAVSKTAVVRRPGAARQEPQRSGHVGVANSSAHTRGPCRLRGLMADSPPRVCQSCAERLEDELARDPRVARPSCGRHRELCAALPCSEDLSAGSRPRKPRRPAAADRYFGATGAAPRWWRPPTGPRSSIPFRSRLARQAIATRLKQKSVGEFACRDHFREPARTKEEVYARATGYAFRSCRTRCGYAPAQ
jgi:hypothetical protein